MAQSQGVKSPRFVVVFRQGDYVIRAFGPYYTVREAEGDADTVRGSCVVELEPPENIELEPPEKLP